MDRAAQNPKEPRDVAVVGADIAGLFAAWRLLDQGQDKLLAVFEAGERVGGRASTVYFPGEPDFDISLGATMLMPEHRLLVKLLDTVAVGTSPFVVATDRNILHLRGKSLSYGKISRFAPRRLFPFAISRRTQAKGPARLMRRAVEMIVPGASKFGREDWNEAAVSYHYRGRPLAEWSARAALATVLAAEELAYLESAIGYSLMVDGPNAAEIFKLVFAELSGGRSYLSPDGGFQQVAERLAERIDALGGAIRLGHTVSSIRSAGQGLVLSITRKGETFEIAARKVVLALPARPLQTIVGNSGSLLDEHVMPLVRRAEPWPMLTLAACYSNAWWEQRGLVAGHSVTDLPARQIWHFGRSAANGNTTRRGVAMVYCDGPQIGFWQDLLPQRNPHHGFAALSPGHPALEAFHRQMIDVYGLPAAAREHPVGGFAQDWGAPAYGGAIHLWSRGTDIAAAGKTHTLAPNLHLCGEAWSNSHGWIEGALESAENFVQQEFGLDPWLD